MKLLEIIMALAIMALIATYAIPTFQSNKAKQEATLTLSKIEQAIQYAKTIAKANLHIYICASDDNKTCSKHAANKFILLTDKGKVLLTFPSLQYGKVQFKVGDNNNNILSITSIITSTPGTFKYSANNNARLTRELTINNNARVRI